MKQLIILAVIFIPALLLGQVGITYTLDNGNYTVSDGQTYFEFDILAHATQTGTRLGTGIVFLEYSTAAFGIDLYRLNNVTITRGTLTYNPLLPVYLILLNDNYSNRLAITFEYTVIPGYGNLVPTSPTQLVHCKFAVQDEQASIWVCFWPNLMYGETFYDDNATIYNPVEIGNCIYEEPFLPVELSSFTCVMNNTNSAVSLNWTTQTETNMVGYRILRGNSDQLDTAEDRSVLINATNSSQTHSYIYNDTDIVCEQLYYYWLEALDMDGTSQYFGPTSIFVPSQTYSAPEIPLFTGLASAYPNPFNPDLTIAYELAGSQSVNIVITNLRGQIVRVLVDSVKDKGRYVCEWDGTDRAGNACCSGMYQIRMLTPTNEYRKKVMLLK